MNEINRSKARRIASDWLPWLPVFLLCALIGHVLGLLALVVAHGGLP